MSAIETKTASTETNTIKTLDDLANVDVVDALNDPNTVWEF